jgi:hypothetical protein
MTNYILPREQTVERIDKLCGRLFELWCEERKLVPLAYLLHCWPLTGHDAAAIKRLADAMSDLSRFQPGKLSARESIMVREVIGSAREQPVDARAARQRSGASAGGCSSGFPRRPLIDRDSAASAKYPDKHHSTRGEIWW